MAKRRRVSNGRFGLRPGRAISVAVLVCATLVPVLAPPRSARAAIGEDVFLPDPAPVASAAPAGAAMSSTLALLDKPLSQRISDLRRQGPDGYRNLVNIMFDENAGMQARWKAVTAAGLLGGPEARPELLRALKHGTWYMRTAGLVALRSVDRAEALKWARKLMSDRALLVRAQAVDVIRELGDRDSAELLWRKLDSPDNFRGEQSLFIRQKIAQALARVEGPGREAAFIKMLNDKDETLHLPAMEALERLTKASPATAEAGLRERRKQWLSWWSAQGEGSIGSGNGADGSLTE